jgi:anti-sigma regulatory factor (Ser/Thr protein kinase)
MTVLTIDPRIKFRCSLAALPTAPRLARQFLSQLLDLWGVDPDTTYSALVAISELVTNSIRHSGRATGPSTMQRGEVSQLIGISAQISMDRLYVEVWDGSETLPTPKDAADDAEEGRGLSIVTNLATRWGAHPAILRHIAGKVTWFEFKLPTPPQPRSARPANEPAAESEGEPAPIPTQAFPATTLPRRQPRRAPLAHPPPRQPQAARQNSRYDTSLAATQRLETALRNLQTQPA